MLRAVSAAGSVLLGEYAMAGLPLASANDRKFAWVTDRPTKAGFMFSKDGAWWDIGRRFDTYAGITNGSGDYTVVFATEFQVAPNVQPVTYPSADAVTRVRVSAVSTAGFTVRSEKNSTVTVLGVDVLSAGTAAVANVPVRVLVSETT